jgi:hypothetical protein
LLLEKVGSQTVGSPYRYSYQQLTPQHGLKMDENSLHLKFQERFAVGLNLKIFYLNIEGISVSKSDYLSRLMREPGPNHNKKKMTIFFCLFWYAQQQNPYNL